MLQLLLETLIDVSKLQIISYLGSMQKYCALLRIAQKRRQKPEQCCQARTNAILPQISS